MMFGDWGENPPTPSPRYAKERAGVREKKFSNGQIIS
jgi:hypothetical protein